MCGFRWIGIRQGSRDCCDTPHYTLESIIGVATVGQVFLSLVELLFTVVAKQIILERVDGLGECSGSAACSASRA